MIDLMADNKRFDPGCTIKKLICPICGNTFYADTLTYAYRVPGKYSGSASCVCSYTCMRTYERKRNADIRT